MNNYMVTLDGESLGLWVVAESEIGAATAFLKKKYPNTNEVKISVRLSVCLGGDASKAINYTATVVSVSYYDIHVKEV